jgi:very-short-patch-repair endonuclease
VRHEPIGKRFRHRASGCQLRVRDRHTRGEAARRRRPLAAGGGRNHHGRHRLQLRRRRLHLLQRGAYRVGPLPQPRARLMAAVLLGGDTARLSHASAAELLSLLDPRASDRIHVSALRNRRVPDWIRLHRVLLLPEDETTVHDHIPITTPARTILDLAGTAPAADVEHAMIEAVRRRLTDRARIAELLERYPGKVGTPLLRDLLERADNPQLTRSEAERRLRELIRAAELANPMMNVRVEGYQVDAYWTKERVVVDVDGFALHSSHAAFQRDRRRDADLSAAGITVIRVTWHQLQAATARGRRPPRSNSGDGARTPRCAGLLTRTP